MVSFAGKEFLKNSINNAKFHNKIIEENEMWRQWELEQGLTMMVSDDVIRKKNSHVCKYHKRKKIKQIEQEKSLIRERKHLLSKTNVKKTEEKWDHSGFAELYPEEAAANSSKSSGKKEQWDHSGFAELYPEEAAANSSKSSGKKEQKRRLESSSSSSDDDDDTSDDSRKEKSITFKRRKNIEHSLKNKKTHHSHKSKRHKKHCKDKRKRRQE